MDDLPHRPSGRPDRAAADAEFPTYQAEVEADPDRLDAVVPAGARLRREWGSPSRPLGYAPRDPDRDEHPADRRLQRPVFELEPIGQ